MRTVVIIFVLAMLGMAASVVVGLFDHSKAVRVIGSTSVQPFAEMLAEEYQRQHPGCAVEVQGGGSTAGIQAVVQNIAEIGTCSRGLKADEAEKLPGITIAMDGLAIVVHPGNPVDALTRAQVHDAFMGKITNWKELGGPDLPIRLITREEGSGTREAFFKLVMEYRDKSSPASGGHGPIRIARSALTQESNGAVKELVKHDPAAIGYMSLGLVQGELKMLTIDGAAPTPHACRDKSYVLVRPFLFVVNGSPAPDTQAFIDFVLSRDGQQLLEKEGLVSAP